MQRCVCISRNFQEMNAGLLILRVASDSQHGDHLPPHLSETPPTPNPTHIQPSLL